MRLLLAIAIGAEGKIGPRLDTLDDDGDDILQSIREPREEIADGYPDTLMPADYRERMSSGELRALAEFIAAASGGEARQDGDDGENRGRRGRGRGRGGRG